MVFSKKKNFNEECYRNTNNKINTLYFENVIPSVTSYLDAPLSNYEKRALFEAELPVPQRGPIGTE